MERRVFLGGLRKFFFTGFFLLISVFAFCCVGVPHAQGACTASIKATPGTQLGCTGSIILDVTPSFATGVRICWFLQGSGSSFYCDAIPPSYAITVTQPNTYIAQINGVDAGDCDGWTGSVTITQVCNCGDGNLDSGEECDDKNTSSGDGCDANCLLESLSCSIVANPDQVASGAVTTGTLTSNSWVTSATLNRATGNSSISLTNGIGTGTHTYTSAGNYILTGIVTHPLSGNVTLSCTDSISVFQNGSCGPAYYSSGYYPPPGPGTGDLCAQGTASGFVYTGALHKWIRECVGENGGTTVECDATELYCGDTLTNGGEICDDGSLNSWTGNGCTPLCNGNTYCGDGYIQNPNGSGTGGTSGSGDEVCDPLANYSDGSCANDCTWSGCPATVTQEWHIYPNTDPYREDTPDSTIGRVSIGGCYAVDVAGTGGILTGSMYSYEFGNAYSTYGSSNGFMPFKTGAYIQSIRVYRTNPTSSLDINLSSCVYNGSDQATYISCLQTAITTALNSNWSDATYQLSVNWYQSAPTINFGNKNNPSGGWVGINSDDFSAPYQTGSGGPTLGYGTLYRSGGLCFNCLIRCSISTPCGLLNYAIDLDDTPVDINASNYNYLAPQPFTYTVLEHGAYIYQDTNVSLTSICATQEEESVCGLCENDPGYPGDCIGTCGSVDGTTIYDADGDGSSLNSGSPNLCDVGVVSGFNYTNGSWTWSCYGTGSSDSCSANEERCGDGIKNGSENCDGGNGCTASCQREEPDCALVTAEWTPVPPYSGQTLTGTFSTTQTGAEFSGSSVVVLTTQGGINTGTVTVVTSGGNTPCSLTVTGGYCGDELQNGGEDCDTVANCTSCTCNAGYMANGSGLCEVIPTCGSLSGSTVYDFDNGGDSLTGGSAGLCGSGTVGIFAYSGGTHSWQWSCVNTVFEVACSADEDRCGDGITNGSEDCDGNPGCQSVCQREAPDCSYVSVEWTPPATPYSGQTLTGTFSTSQTGAIFSGSNVVVLTTQGGVNTGTVTIVIAEETLNCSLTITGGYCGDGIRNGGEECDDVPDCTSCACDAGYMGDESGQCIKYDCVIPSFSMNINGGNVEYNYTLSLWSGDFDTEIFSLPGGTSLSGVMENQTSGTNLSLNPLIGVNTGDYTPGATNGDLFVLTVELLDGNGTVVTSCNESASALVDDTCGLLGTGGVFVLFNPEEYFSSVDTWCTNSTITGFAALAIDTIVNPRTVGWTCGIMPCQLEITPLMCFVP